MIQKVTTTITQKTLQFEVKCIDEIIIDKNFETILGLIKDFENKHSSMEKRINELIDKNDRMEKQLLGVKQTNNKDIARVSSGQSKRDSKHRQGSREKSSREKSNINSSGNQELSEFVKQLKERVQKQSQLNKKNNLQNIKDINLLLKDVKALKQKVDSLQTNSNTNVPNNNEIVSNQSNQSLQENIRVIQNELHRHSQKLDKLHSQIDKMKSKNSSILEKIKGLDNNNNPEQPTVASNNNDNDLNQKQFQSLRNQISVLEKNLKDNENKNRNDIRNLTIRLQNVDISLKQLENRVGVNEQDISQLKERLVNTNVTNNGDNNGNLHSERERDNFDRQIRRLEETNKKLNNKNEEWKRKIEDNIKQHTLNISDIQSQISDLQNTLSSLQKEKQHNKYNSSMKQLDDSRRGSDRLPSLAAKKNLKLKNSTKQEDLEKRLQDLKNEIQQWVKQLLDTRGMASQDSYRKKDEVLDAIDLKIQEIKVALEKKADQEGMKKYLSFLDNKINQIWSIMSQPDSEDALIARKGWNCLSCAKKLEKYRGRVGEHINWNNMTTTNYSPPRVGFTQHVSHNTTQQNLTSPLKGRFGINQQDMTSKDFS